MGASTSAMTRAADGIDSRRAAIRILIHGTDIE
jgi:hypothetical protein